MKIITLPNTFLAVLFAALFAISGCSSSSSETSSGGGSGSPPEAGQPPGSGTPPSSIAGTYTGTATATASALGLSESETVPVTIVIDQAGRVTVQSESDIFPNVITMNGNSFSQSQTFNNQDFGSAKCSGALTLQGAVNSNGTFTANLSSQSVNCDVNGINIPGTVTGTLTATKQG